MTLRWPRRPRRARPVSAPRAPEEATVVRPRSPDLTSVTVAGLAADVAAAGGRDVVIDLSSIEQWDSDGAAGVAELAEASLGRVRLDGFGEATSRLLGLGSDTAAAGAPPPGEAIEVNRLHEVLVLRPTSAAALGEQRLDAAIEAQPRTTALVVVDLAAAPELDSAAVQELCFVSSGCALHGQELLVVNVGERAAEALRRAGLSAQTWVAPAAETPHVEAPGVEDSWS